MKKYAIAIIVNGPEEYMRQQHGDDCYTDDIGHATLFDSLESIPTMASYEYVVEVEYDEDEGLYVVGKAMNIL